jgi:hypothetical protein
MNRNHQLRVRIHALGFGNNYGVSCLSAGPTANTAGASITSDWSAVIDQNGSFTAAPSRLDRAISAVSVALRSTD